MDKRINEHNYSKTKSAKYTRGRKPLTLVYVEQVKTLSEALKREYKIKLLHKSEKELLVQCFKKRKS